MKEEVVSSLFWGAVGGVVGYFATLFAIVLWWGAKV